MFLELLDESSMSLITLELSKKASSLKEFELGDNEEVSVVSLDEVSSHSFRRTNDVQFCLIVINFSSLNKYLCRLASNLLLTLENNEK